MKDPESTLHAEIDYYRNALDQILVLTEAYCMGPITSRSTPDLVMGLKKIDHLASNALAEFKGGG